MTNHQVNAGVNKREIPDLHVHPCPGGRGRSMIARFHNWGGRRARCLHTANQMRDMIQCHIMGITAAQFVWEPLEGPDEPPHLTQTTPQGPFSSAATAGATTSATAVEREARQARHTGDEKSGDHLKRKRVIGKTAPKNDGRGNLRD